MRSSRAAATAALALMVPASAQAVDWPVFHFDATHSGLSPETAISAANASALKQRWQVNTGSAVYSSPAVATSAKLGKQVVYIGNQAGTMSAYDAATGARVWARDLPASIASSPAVVNGVVYFGSHDHYFYALDAATGALRCRFHTGGVSTAAPAVVNVPGIGLVAFFGDNGLTGNDDGGHLWAVNAVDPNAAADCTRRWSFTGWGNPPGSARLAGSWSPPAYAVTGGRPLVVFGSSSPDNAAYALDARTGARVWRYAPGAKYRDADFGAGPALSPPGANGFADGVAYVVGKNRHVHALNLRTGARIWETNLDTIVGGVGTATRSTPALVGTRLVLGIGSGILALDAATGRKVWTSAPRTPETISSPAVTGPASGRVVFALDTGGTLRGVSFGTGAQVFAAKLGGLGYSSPAVAGGRVFVGGGNGFLYAFGGGAAAAGAPETTIGRPADGATIANPAGDLVISGSASDNTSVRQVLVSVEDTNTGRWWSPSARAWVAVFTQWPATLGRPGAASTAWSARFPVPRAGGSFLASAEAVDGGGVHDASPDSSSFVVTSLGNPPNTTITAPTDGQRFAFGRNPDGTPRRESFRIAIRGTATDSGGATPGISAVRVEVLNREHGEYWCGPRGCPGLPTTFWRPAPITVAAALGSPGAASTTWSSGFQTYDHPHTYAIRAWAIDRDGEADLTRAVVPRICVTDPGVFACPG